MSSIRYAVTDLNGQFRGKRTIASDAAKLGNGSARMPLSCLNLDLWGEDIEDSPLYLASGDADGLLLPTGRGPVPFTWLHGSPDFYPMWSFHNDETAFMGDPRHAFDLVLKRYAAKGWRVMAATELEFTLLDPASVRPAPPPDPLTGKRAIRGEVTSLRKLDSFDAFFSDLYAAAEAMELPAQTAISESGVGQFEINLAHQDAMSCADDTMLFKHVVKGVARQHGMLASFMAKPYADDAGNGMHVHFSLLDRDGANIFNDGTDRGTDALHHAVAGCLAAMPASSLIFAPHDNSYARLAPGSHAPTGAAWAYENRTTAIRVPGGPREARRIEHRTPGGDTNAYLVLAAILGAALNGIEAAQAPSNPISGNAYKLDLPGLAPDWTSAIDAFDAPEIHAIFHADLIANLLSTKRQEQVKFAQLTEPEKHQLIVETV